VFTIIETLRAKRFISSSTLIVFDMAKDNIDKQSYNTIAFEWTEDRKNSFGSNLIIDFANGYFVRREF